MTHVNGIPADPRASTTRLQNDSGPWGIPIPFNLDPFANTGQGLVDLFCLLVWWSFREEFRESLLLVLFPGGRLCLRQE
jgi:hypothetical protein